MILPEVTVKNILKHGGKIMTVRTQAGVYGLNSNGGSYDCGCTVLVNCVGSVVGGRHYTSYDDGCCPACGVFGDHDDNRGEYEKYSGYKPGDEVVCLDLNTQVSSPAVWEEIDPIETYLTFIPV